LVAGLGELAGGRDRPLVTAVGSAVGAVAFQPVRLWAARLANRVVYGRRATPYQVLSEFARRIGVAYSVDDVLPQLARVVATGTGAEQVVVWRRLGSELVPQASAGSGPAPVSIWRPVSEEATSLVPDSDLAVPVVHGGVQLGAVSIRMPGDEALRAAGQQLVTDVASQAGLVLANAGLVADLRASRQRLVTAQDDARRRLERDIHDGAQQDLVALAIKLGLAEAEADSDASRGVLGRAAACGRGADCHPAGPGPGPLPAIARRPRIDRRASRAGRSVTAARRDRRRRDRAVRPGRRNSGLLLLSGSPAEHGQIR